MKNSFLFKENRRINYTSKYNVKLYKKCLSLKLILLTKKSFEPNLIIARKKEKIPVKFLKRLYCRKERIPLRLLRFFSLLDYTKLIKFGLRFLISKKLSVYNGKRAKLINVNQDYLK